MTTIEPRPTCEECKRPISERVIAHALRSGEEPRFHSPRCRARWHSRASRRRREAEARAAAEAAANAVPIPADVWRAVQRMNRYEQRLHLCGICKRWNLGGLHDDADHEFMVSGGPE